MHSTPDQGLRQSHISVECQGRAKNPQNSNTVGTAAFQHCDSDSAKERFPTLLFIVMVARRPLVSKVQFLKSFYGLKGVSTHTGLPRDLFSAKSVSTSITWSAIMVTPPGSWPVETYTSQMDSAPWHGSIRWVNCNSNFTAEFAVSRRQAKHPMLNKQMLPSPRIRAYMHQHCGTRSRSKCSFFLRRRAWILYGDMSSNPHLKCNRAKPLLRLHK